MSKSIFLGLLSALIASLVATKPARAFTVNERMHEEWEAAGGEILADKATGRHKWAVRCRVVDPKQKAMLDFFVEQGLFASFTRTDGSGGLAPFHQDAPCNPPGTWRLVGSFPLGCFAHSTRLLFGDVWRTIPDAVNSSQSKLTALDTNSTLFNQKLRMDVEVQSYTHGLEKYPVITVSVINGKKITVTKNHPMIGGHGEIIPAQELVANAFVLTLDGPQRIVGIEEHYPDEEVWNIRPTSSDPLNNVLIAEGFFTGSIRFQNEWADRAFRLMVAESMSAADVAAFVE